MVTGIQISAARALLVMTKDELASKAGLPQIDLDRLEASSTVEDDPAMAVLQRVLEEAGVTFIDERVTSAAGGPGVRLSVPLSGSLDAVQSQTVQYPEMAKEGPFGAGG